MLAPITSDCVQMDCPSSCWPCSPRIVPQNIDTVGRGRAGPRRAGPGALAGGRIREEAGDHSSRRKRKHAGTALCTPIPREPAFVYDAPGIVVATLCCVQQYQESLPLFKMLLALLWQHCAVYSCSRKRTAAGTALCVQLYDVRARSGLSTCMKGTVLDQESMKGTVLDQESPFP